MGLQKQAPPMSSQLTKLETLATLVTTSGAFFAAVQQYYLIALTVAVGVMINNLIQHKCLQPRLQAINAAIRDLRSIMIMMDSLSVVEKRTAEKKTYAVGTVEAAVMTTVTAWTGAS